MLDSVEDEEKSNYQFRQNIYMGDDSKHGSYLNYCPNQLRFDNDNSSNNLHYSPLSYFNIQKNSSINNSNSNNNIFRRQPYELKHSSNLLGKYSSPEKISYHSSENSNNENKYLANNDSLDGNPNNGNGSYYKDFLQKVFGDEHHLKKGINFQNDEVKGKNIKLIKKNKNKIRPRPKKLLSINYEEKKNNNNLISGKERFSIKMKNKRKLSSILNVDKVNNTGTNYNNNNNNYKQTISTGNNKQQSNKNLMIKNYNDKKKSSLNSFKKKRTGGESPYSQLNSIEANEFNSNHYHKVKFHNKNLGRNKKSKKKVSKCLIKDEENIAKELSMKKTMNNKEVKSPNNTIKNSEVNGKEKEEKVNIKDIKNNTNGHITKEKTKEKKNNKKKKIKKGFFSFCSCCLMKIKDDDI